MDYRLSWKPQDEIAFVEGLTHELVLDGKDSDGRTTSLEPGPGPFVSLQRPQTRAQRLEALRKYLAVLPYRHFPGWSQAEQQAVIRQATEIYAKANTQALEAG